MMKLFQQVFQYCFIPNRGTSIDFESIKLDCFNPSSIKHLTDHDVVRAEVLVWDAMTITFSSSDNDDPHHLNPGGLKPKFHAANFPIKAPADLVFRPFLLRQVT